MVTPCDGRSLLVPHNEDPGEKRLEGGVSLAYLPKSWRSGLAGQREKEGVCGKFRRQGGHGVSAPRWNCRSFSPPGAQSHWWKPRKNHDPNPRPSMNMTDQNGDLLQRKSTPLSAGCGRSCRLCSFVQLERGSVCLHVSTTSHRLHKMSLYAPGLPAGAADWAEAARVLSKFSWVVELHRT